MQYLVLSAFVFICIALPVHADKQKGYWELGAGLSYLQSPHYYGSDESKNYLVPFPHVLVESDSLSIDRNSVRGHVLSTDDFKFDISFSGAFKVDGEDNQAREGMPDLDYILEAGPALKWLLKGSFKGPDRLTLDLPVRAALATDFSTASSIGWRALPTLHWYKTIVYEGQWILENRLRLIYSTRDYHDYLYSVDMQYVTPDRVYYQAKSGFSGWQNRFTVKRKTVNRILGFYIAYTNVADAVYNDSPLVKENYNFSAGVFVSWVIGSGYF